MRNVNGQFISVDKFFKVLTEMEEKLENLKQQEEIICKLRMINSSIKKELELWNQLTEIQSSITKTKRDVKRLESLN